MLRLRGRGEVVAVYEWVRGIGGGGEGDVAPQGGGEEGEEEGGGDEFEVCGEVSGVRQGRCKDGRG